MTKSDLIDAIYEETGMTKKDVGTIVNSTFDVISNYLSEEAKKEPKNRQGARIIGFGKFEVRNRAERKGRNPKTREEIIIPARSVPAFKTGKSLKEKVDA